MLRQNIYLILHFWCATIWSGINYWFNYQDIQQNRGCRQGIVRLEQGILKAIKSGQDSALVPLRLRNSWVWRESSSSVIVVIEKVGEEIPGISPTLSTHEKPKISLISRLMFHAILQGRIDMLQIPVMGDFLSGIVRKIEFKLFLSWLGDMWGLTVTLSRLDVMKLFVIQSLHWHNIISHPASSLPPASLWEVRGPVRWRRRWLSDVRPVIKLGLTPVSSAVEGVWRHPSHLRLAIIQFPCLIGHDESGGAGLDYFQNLSKHSATAWARLYFWILYTSDQIGDSEGRDALLETW